MSHDPFSAFTSGTSPTSEILLLPRVTGRVNGSEIPFKEGDYSYVGTIEFNGGVMHRDLYYDNTDDKKRTKTAWNGRYELRLAEK
jgi:hypothetical protein